MLKMAFLQKGDHLRQRCRCSSALVEANVKVLSVVVVAGCILRSLGVYR